MVRSSARSRSSSSFRLPHSCPFGTVGLQHAGSSLDALEQVILLREHPPLSSSVPANLRQGCRAHGPAFHSHGTPRLPYTPDRAAPRLGRLSCQLQFGGARRPEKQSTTFCCSGRRSATRPDSPSLGNRPGSRSSLRRDDYAATRSSAAAPKATGDQTRPAA